MAFVEFPKVARLNREVIVTEKIDGTNASVLFVARDGCTEHPSTFLDEFDGTVMLAGSRTRFITPAQDNQGFAGWAWQNREELRKLGPGQHFGEWWGQGIQRRYGLTEKRFSLFNVARWADDSVRPGCCHVVPELWRGPMLEMNASTIGERLMTLGSVAAPGFMQPEGYVVFHTHGGVGFKYTFDKNDGHKGAP